MAKGLHIMDYPLSFPFPKFGKNAPEPIRGRIGISIVDILLS
jgi:hypothetical protein